MKVLQKSNLAAYKKVIETGAEKTIELLKEKGLKGRGGANFPTGLKWELARKTKSDEKFIICNADEGEPGTFKDHLLLRENPQTLIEGILISAHCINTKQAYIYLRGEYHYLRDILEKTIKQILTDVQLVNKIKIDIIEGAGAYICGDETAIINSINNRRGCPSFKPPYPPQKGLFEKPTVINNVETLVNIPLAIIDKEWDDNLRLFSISGDILNPGVYELNVGIAMSRIIEIVKPKGKIKAFYFGASGGCLPYNKKTIIESTSIAKMGAALGSNSIIIVNNKRNIIDLAINITEFFCRESCGKCTPCRVGNFYLLNLLNKIKSRKATKNDFELLEKLCIFIRDTSLCGLGQSCTNHILTAKKYFKNEIKDK